MNEILRFMQKCDEQTDRHTGVWNAFYNRLWPQAGDNNQLGVRVFDIQGSLYMQIFAFKTLAMKEIKNKKTSVSLHSKLISVYVKPDPQ